MGWSQIVCEDYKFQARFQDGDDAGDGGFGVSASEHNLRKSKSAENVAHRLSVDWTPTQRRKGSADVVTTTTPDGRLGELVAGGRDSLA